MPTQPTVTVLIPAAGSGSRMGSLLNKVLLPLGGIPMLVHTVFCFQSHPRVDHIGLILRPEDMERIEEIFPKGNKRKKLLPWIAGGEERQDSVRNGLTTLAQSPMGPPDQVLVHDGARPFCSTTLIDRVLKGLEISAGVIPVLPVQDTIRRMTDAGSEVVDRQNLFRTQTPQGFQWRPLWEAHARDDMPSPPATDDAQLLERMGSKVSAVAGEPVNVKITTPDDLAWAESWLSGSGVSD